MLLGVELRPGMVLGRYELLVRVGQGGMAQVWAARQTGSRGFQKIVALKVMLPYMMDEPNFEKMFLAEASLASQVRHPHVVQVLDLGDSNRVLYLVMEWIDGEPLNVVMQSAAERGGIPPTIAVNIAMQVCRGLHAIHELPAEDGQLLGLVHRDISPQNILVGYDGVVKIVDFGVAKATARISAESTLGLKGKIPYMSPEQLRGEAIDRRTDIFALGIVMYMMTTGYHPFRGDSDPVTITNIASEKPALLPSQIVPGYPRGLESVVIGALEKDRNRRFGTSLDVLRALETALPLGVPIASDQDVAAFLRSSLPTELADRRRAIGGALEKAKRHPRHVTSGRADVAALEATPTQGAAPAETPGQAPKAPWWRSAPWLVVALMAVAFSSGALIAKLRSILTRPTPPAVSLTVSAAARNAAEEQQTFASPRASETAAAEARDGDSQSDAAATGSAPTKPLHTAQRPSRRSSRKTSPATSAPATKNHTTSVTEPGF